MEYILQIKNKNVKNFFNFFKKNYIIYTIFLSGRKPLLTSPFPLQNSIIFLNGLHFFLFIYNERNNDDCLKQNLIAHRQTSDFFLSDHYYVIIR